MIYLTSDLHLGHDREFIYKPRGFGSIKENDETIIERFNELNNDDILFLLGDLMLGDNEYGINCLNSIKCKKYFIPGNHDTDARVKLYEENNIKYLGNLDYYDLDMLREQGVRWKRCTDSEFSYRKFLTTHRFNFKLSHQPTLTGNLEAESLNKTLINLYGHTHQKNNFYEDRPYMYHVGVDSHNCHPVSLEKAIEDMQDKVIECSEFL